jgi:YegS/Rv2252/BmrU family lipid kinase
LGLVTKIHFIVNPVAGSGGNTLTREFLSDFFGSDHYEFEIKVSTYAKHAIALANDSVAEKAHIIVACGGDGTINEVASCLVHTNSILGILPLGSGNGLASNLKISKNISKALLMIKNFKVIEIDAGLINNELFFSNAGFGFDAHVISDFEKNTSRKLWGYVRSVIKTVKHYDYQTIELEYLDRKRTLSPFLLFISNSNEMGYKMSLTPKASLQDGLLDLIIVPKLSFAKMLVFTFLFFLKKHHWLKNVELIKTDSLILSHNNGSDIKIQKDGESMKITENRIEIKLIPRALKVCVN